MLGAVLAVPARLLPIWGLSVAARTGAASSLTIPISTSAVVVLGVPAVAATGAWVVTRPASTTLTPRGR